jgi:hypothetical protein
VDLIVVVVGRLVIFLVVPKVGKAVYLTELL